MNELLNDVIEKNIGYTHSGRVADYIPELAKVDKHKLGISIVTKENAVYCAGDYAEKFTMQSVVKPLIFLLALIDNGIDRVRELVGVEATGKPFDGFNYSDQKLSRENINPMVNAGAIAMCTLIKGDTYERKFARLLDLARTASGNPQLAVDEKVYLSEKATGSKNRALAYMMKAYGLIDEDVEAVLECYFRACSISVTARDLANIGLVFANGGVLPGENEPLFEKKYCQYVNAVLITSGMYDGSGEFALNVGVPAKSGVGGGIMAVVPGKMGIGIFSPALDKKGNSIAGVKALEMLSNQLELSVF